jgi:hypothetical protein
MLASGRKMPDMVKEISFGRTEMCIRANGKTTRNKELELIKRPMGILILVSGRRIK